MGPQGTLLHMSHSIVIVFLPHFTLLSPEILIFQEQLIVET